VQTSPRNAGTSACLASRPRNAAAFVWLHPYTRHTIMVTTYKRKAAHLSESSAEALRARSDAWGSVSARDAAGETAKADAPTRPHTSRADRGKRICAVLAPHLPKLFEHAAADPLPRDLGGLLSRLQAREQA
jgi:hypothetical protein